MLDMRYNLFPHCQNWSPILKCVLFSCRISLFVHSVNFGSASVDSWTYLWGAISFWEQYQAKREMLWIWKFPFGMLSKLIISLFYQAPRYINWESTTWMYSHIHCSIQVFFCFGWLWAPLSEFLLFVLLTHRSISLRIPTFNGAFLLQNRWYILKLSPQFYSGCSLRNLTSCCPSLLFPVEFLAPNSPLPLPLLLPLSLPFPSLHPFPPLFPSPIPLPPFPPPFPSPFPSPYLLFSLVSTIPPIFDLYVISIKYLKLAQILHMVHLFCKFILDSWSS